PTPHGHDYFALRDGLQNSRIRFEHDKQGRVAFLGGSITTMEGWRGLTYKSMQKRFPDTEFDFVHAGIPSVDSTGDAFRLMRDVFGRGQVDLLFVEASVNDLHNRRDHTERIRAMEGIVRQARRENPNIDVVFMCFVDVPFIKEFDAGKTPEIIADHLKVAEHYKIASINLAKEVTERIAAGEFKWEKFRNCHPSPFGHALYNATIERMLGAACASNLPAEAKTTAHTLPTSLEVKNYQRGRLVDLEVAELGDGWKIDPQWKPTLKAGTRAGFVNVPMLVAEQPGATLTLKFDGTAIGMFVVAGPDTGDVEYSIDGGEKKTLSGFTRWSGGLYLPWPFVFDADLAPGEHELTLTTAAGKNAKSKGNATRIVKFLVN
ncbi:MAG: sialidase-1, partial [Pseudoalteromonas tetraodonis]